MGSAKFGICNLLFGALNFYPIAPCIAKGKPTHGAQEGWLPLGIFRGRVGKEKNSKSNRGKDSIKDLTQLLVVPLDKIER